MLTNEQIKVPLRSFRFLLAHSFNVIATSVSGSANNTLLPVFLNYERLS